MTYLNLIDFDDHFNIVSNVRFKFNMRRFDRFVVAILMEISIKHIIMFPQTHQILL